MKGQVNNYGRTNAAEGRYAAKWTDAAEGTAWTGTAGTERSKTAG